MKGLIHIKLKPLKPKFEIDTLVGLNKLGRETYPAIGKSIFNISNVFVGYDDNFNDTGYAYLIEIIGNADDNLIGQELVMPEEYLCLVKKRQIEVTEEQIAQLNNNEITVEDIINSNIQGCV